MIYSKEHKYLFIETPHTGSSALSAELVAQYSGQSVLTKHANYWDFKREYGSAVRDLIVFATVRHPLQEVLSLFHKYLSNHKGNYTNEQLWMENGGWISKKKRDMYRFVQETRDFEAFVLRYYRRPFTSSISINHPHCDCVLRFENLEQDFANVLTTIGLDKVRTLPVVNQTEYSTLGLNHGLECLGTKAIKPFLPFMREWGYEACDVEVTEAGWKEDMGYKLAKSLRLLHALTINRMNSPVAMLTRARWE